MSPPNANSSLRVQLRCLATQTLDVLVPSADLITLLDYIKELEIDLELAWEDRMGEDL